MATENTVYLIYPSNWFEFEKDSVIPCVLVARLDLIDDLSLSLSASLRFKYKFERKKIKTSLMVIEESGFISPEIISTHMDMMKIIEERNYMYYRIDPSRNEFCEFLYPEELQEARDKAVNQILNKLIQEKS